VKPPQGQECLDDSRQPASRQLLHATAQSGTDNNEEGTAPGVAQGAGAACRCMPRRRTVSPCHVALSTDSRLLIQVRPCGPSSTTLNRRSWSKMARADTIYSQGRSESGRALPVQCTMTKSGETMFAHIQGPAAQRPADASIMTVALHFIDMLFCCAACLEVSRALEESPTLHRGPQARRVNTTTTLLVAARAPKPVAVCN